ncbi:putative oxidoreductase [Corynebacterium kutscheri]|uniref:LLM-partnered FMN reductase, CE1759 family n=1 Tax=Corynebacterium kutscheri TaxID=35755 RepID=A0A0F6R291_9CORY|nr:FMN reductase [Corynebacterium kutscheri]AKE41483.1 LLM-partnered FMN reductase, CE1759 family [Corynebacterium kutscheri]VEH08761.1 putative oxidoreductase [Corynebacterium kutscheri]VEH09807.1 putative oxidoreductase [Corynebacterium kutscheri]VEH79890.1 putative oxidoreductase [Corynebacterium kutscheri]
MKRLVVIAVGLSVPSTTLMLAERIAGSVEAQVSKRGEGLETQIINIRDLAMDLAQLMTTGIPSEKLRTIQDAVSAADALVAVTPVFSASFSGLFKMFVDSLGTNALNGMPMIIAATAGTPRHSLVLDHALRPLFTYLRAVIMPSGVFAATEDFGGNNQLQDRITRAARELASYIVRTEVSVAGFGPDFSDTAQPRTSGTTVPTTITNFADLLKGHDGCS